MIFIVLNYFLTGERYSETPLSHIEMSDWSVKERNHHFKNCVDHSGL